LTVFNRRTLLKRCTAAAAARGLLGAPAPALSIARYKTSPKEGAAIAEAARRLTRQAIDGLGGMARFVSRGDVVMVKPNIAWDRRPEQAANTNPDVVAALVELCLQAGARRVLVTDHTTNAAPRTFPRSGIQEAARAAGAHVSFVDQRKFRRMPIHGKVLKEWEVYTDAVEADRLINVAIVKHHGLCKVTLGMKNLMGVIGGARNRYHQDLDATIPDLADFFKPQLIVLDAVRVLVANGPTGGNLADVERRDIVLAGTDQVAVDAFGATLLGHKPGEVGHIAEAARRKLGTLDYDSLSPRRFEVG
jgi:uncharacterized protein (DUF362 family)